MCMSMYMCVYVCVLCVCGVGLGDNMYLKLYHIDLHIFLYIVRTTVFVEM